MTPWLISSNTYCKLLLSNKRYNIVKRGNARLSYFSQFFLFFFSVHVYSQNNQILPWKKLNSMTRLPIQKYVTSYRSTLQSTSRSRAASSTRWCITYRSFLIRKMMHLLSCLLFFFCCGNETFLCGDSELKARKGFWFTVTYGEVLP